MTSKFVRERVRFRVGSDDILVIQGWFEGDTGGEKSFSAELDGRELPVETIRQKGVEVTKKYLRYKTNVQEEYFLMIHLPEGFRNAFLLRVYMEENAGKRLIYTAPGVYLRRLNAHLPSWMESLQKLPDGKLRLRGWYISSGAVKTAVLDGKGKKIPLETARIPRMDILGDYPDASPDEAFGFELTFREQEENFLRLILSGPEGKALYVVNCQKMLSGKEGLFNIARKSWRYFRRKGAKAFVRRVQDQVLGIDSISYEHWRRKYGTTGKELARQKTETFPLEPRFSIVVPLYRTPEKFLKEMIDSVKEQTYGNWELILSDGSGYRTDSAAEVKKAVPESSEAYDEMEQMDREGPAKGEDIPREDTPFGKLLRRLAAGDARIRILEDEGGLRIAPNTNRALAAAEGDYIVFGDHDDLFAPDALYECAKLLNERPETELIYTDEDKVDGTGKRFFEPHFKSDYNPELLGSMNYFCHMVVVKRSLFEKAGWLDADFDGAQDYDFVLRCTEQTEASLIAHIPKILYHWRSHAASTAENPESKRYAFEAGKRALQAHYDRMGIRASVSEGLYPGLYETEFAITDEPLISVLIPNKDHGEDLTKCIRSILEKSDYSNFEIIVIENNSTEDETFALYRHLESMDERIRVVDFGKGDGTFNYSAINNFGAAHAGGEYLLLLNNDTEMMRPDCLRRMLEYCQQEEIGIVGARLYYEDGSIQHAGVVLGFGGIAGHAFIGEPGSANGYFSRIICAQDYSAVTAACMMTKAEVYRRVGGLTEELKVAFNDIDYCMKVRAEGLRVVYQPRAELYHYESKSRGLETTQDKIERFNREMALFLDRWGGQVKAGDPYYNPNLTLDKADFSLKL